MEPAVDRSLANPQVFRDIRNAGAALACEIPDLGGDGCRSRTAVRRSSWGRRFGHSHGLAAVLPAWVANSFTVVQVLLRDAVELA
jgi:hypothetical protein